MQRLEVVQEYALPVERVYAYLSEHETLGPLLGARITRVSDGATSRNGAGSARRLKVGPLPAFVETVTAAVPDERIEYRITSGVTPVRDHRGELVFASTPGGSRVTWTIELGAVVPLLDRVLALALERNVRAGLARVGALA